MNASPDAGSGAASTAPMTGKVEFQLRGEPAALERLRQALDEVGVYVQVDHEYRNTVWDDEIALGALMVPISGRAPIEAGADA